MSFLSDLASAIKALVLLKDDVARLKVRVDKLDDRERETRDRLVYLEGLIAGAQTRTNRPPRLPPA